MRDPIWKVLARETLHTTSYGIELAVEVVQLPDGRIVDDFYRLEKPSSVIVAATTRAGEFIVLHQYFHGAGRVGLAFPGGMLEVGEDPLEAAKRELLEESGYRAEGWEPLGSFVRDANQGYGTEHYFLARDAVRVAEPDSGDLEDSEVLLLPQDELAQALFGGGVPIAGHMGLMAAALLKRQMADGEA